MTPALQAVLSRLEQLGISAEVGFAPGPPAQLIVPAKDAATGGLIIYDEPPELTVELEEKHHSHFETPQEAGDFVADVICERVCVTVDYLGSRCIGSSYFQLEREGVTTETLWNSRVGLRGGDIRSERFLWSGPVNDRRRLGES